MTASNYAGVFDGRLPFGERPVLIVIDVVMVYRTPGSPLYDAAFETALVANERLVAEARAAFVPARSKRSSTASSPFVVREACIDRHPALHAAHLFDLQAKYAEVKPR